MIQDMSEKTPSKSAKLWGGRFEGGPDREFFAFNRSFAFDQRLLASDLRASAAHASTLQAAGILDTEECKKLRAALEKIVVDVRAKPELLADPEIEDVHSFIEGRLVQELGDLGKKIHAGRSRNDQVATALRLWLREESLESKNLLDELLRGILKLAKKGQDLPLPAYTHLQRAQPILWAHWCLAYFEMFERDRDRLEDLVERINVMPLGSGALSGTGLPLDREIARKELGFASLSRNSLDAVSDRDFVIEWMGFSSLLLMHMSRMAEDLILYSSHEFSFVEFSDEVTSGSSLMPQKKNPDALELLRGKFGRVLGALTGTLSMMKGLPTAYNKDLQEDKEALFDCVDSTHACLKNLRLILGHLNLKTERMKSEAEIGYMNATDLADLCVLAGMPFREAHEKIGALVQTALKKGVELGSLGEDEILQALPKLGKGIKAKLTLASCLERKTAEGSTGPLRLREALAAAELRIS